MSSSAYAYGVIGYKLDTRKFLYKPFSHPTNSCCEYELGGYTSNNFCPNCGTNLEQFKFRNIDGYDGDKLFDVKVYTQHWDRKNLSVPAVISVEKDYASCPSYKKFENIIKLDISKMEEHKIKIKEVLKKLEIEFEEERFGIWVISELC